MKTPTDLILQYNPKGKLPIDPEDIARQAGLRVIEVDFQDPEVVSDYRRDLKEIRIARDLPLNRRRYTIAHNLGHHFLGHTEEQMGGTADIRGERHDERHTTK